MISLLEALIAKGLEGRQGMSPALLEGEWELVGREGGREGGVEERQKERGRRAIETF
jgi:hypothetical protein